MFELSVVQAVVATVVAVGVIVTVGPRMVRVADRLADATGWGEALVGALLVGAVTSLPDIITTVQPALRGFGELAVGNALGGVLGQTAFLAVADLTYRRANLEHAAASLPNIVQATLLVTLLGGVIILFVGPQGSILGVHPGSVALVVAYLAGLRVVSKTSRMPMWQAVSTKETRQDVPDDDARHDRVGPLALRFAGLALVLAGAGWFLAVGGESLVTVGGLSQTTVGVFVTGVGSSLAELVVSLSAVRQGALTLAVGNVIGGNTFDTLLVAVADVGYRDGSVYAAAGGQPVLVAALALVATAVLILGMLRRERHGPVNIGFESVLVIGLYGFAMVVLLGG